MRWFAVLAAALALGACVDMDDRGSTITGTSGDVSTEPGTYAGYRVVSPCEDRYVNIGVTGTGTLELTEAADVIAAGQDLGATMRDMSSIWGYGGYGFACEPGLGTTIYTDNWQDVDMMLGRIGEYLREHDYALQVGVSVDSQPVAD